MEMGRRIGNDREALYCPLGTRSPCSLRQAPADRCLLHLPLGPAAGAAPGRALSTGCLTRLARHTQVQYHVPVLPGGLHRSCGYKKIDRPTEVPAPKVREAAVIAGGRTGGGRDGLGPAP